MSILKQLVQFITSASFWKVIFGWKKIKSQILDVLFEIQKLIDSGELTQSQLESTQRALHQSDIQLSSAQQRIYELNQDKAQYSTELTSLRDHNRSLSAEVAQLKRTDEIRYDEHHRSLQTLSELKDRVIEEQRQEKEAKHNAEQERLAILSRNWQHHQQDVKNKIMLLCEKYTIQYVHDVPFKGNPDNVLLICQQYAVFDSKSPRGEDLKNFPTYVAKEAHAATKYAEKKDVRPDIYFVVPSNTLEELKQTVYEFEKHRVILIPIEALDPVLMSLKRIEDFEIVEQLSPEGREAVCRIIGRLIHNIKRNVQVDLYMSRESLSLANDCAALLPLEIAKEVATIERAMVVNPSQERKGKEIQLDDLQQDLQSATRLSAVLFNDGTTAHN
jgi:hypothetical protein